MKKAFCAAVALGSTLFVSSLKAQDPVAATVNGKVIKVSEVLAEMKGLDLGKDAQKDQVFGLIRDRLIDVLLLVDAAKKANLESDPDVKKAIEKITGGLLLRAYVEREVKKGVTEAAIKEGLAKIPPQNEVRLRHIMVKDEKTAGAVVKALKAGNVDFAKLAKEKSIDKQTAGRGGELGSVLEGQLPSSFAEAIKDLKPGAFTEKPVKTDMGYHVIKLDARSPARPETLVPLVREQLEREALLKLVSAEKEKAKIEKFDQEGKPVQEKPAQDASKPAQRVSPPSPAAPAK